jgi:hypothetical protein
VSALVLLPLLLAARQDGELTDLDREVQAELTETRAEGPVVLHWAPGALAPEALEEDVRANVAAFHELEEALAMRFEGRVHVFLYEDAAELARLTGTDTIAFSTGARSVHQVEDFRGTHELAHVFATQFPTHANAFTDGFVVEGLATGLTEYESGAPLHAWCAVYGQLGRLPALWELRTRFPDGAPGGVHPYHVAGSFVRFLIESYGIERVKAFYVDALEARAVLGRGFVALERDWLRMLQDLDVAPEYEDVVRRRLGLARVALEGEWVEEARFDGASLSGWTAQDEGVWSLAAGRLVGRHGGPWSSLSSAPVVAEGVRVRFRLREGDAFRIVLAAEGARSELVLTWQATFLDTGAGYRRAEEPPIVHGFWNDLVLVRSHGRERVFVNGLLHFDDERSAVKEPGRIELGVESGVVDVRSVAA